MNERGTTFLEVVLYIGFLLILLPAFALFLVYANQQFQHISQRTQYSVSSALLIDELVHDLRTAGSIQSASSTFGSTSSILSFIDEDGQAVTYERANDSVTRSNETYTVSRIRKTVTGTSHWITPEDVQVDTFQLDVIRDSANAEQGLRFTITLSPITTVEGPFGAATRTITGSTAFSGHTSYD